MTQAGYLIVAFVIAAAVAIYSTFLQPAPLEPTRKHGKVAFVIDGDTIILDQRQMILLRQYIESLQ